MKRNKQLSNEVNKNLSKYEDKDSLNILKNELKASNNTKKAKHSVLFSSLSIAIIICIVVTTILLLSPSKQNEKTYMQDNRQFVTSNINELNQHTGYIDFNNTNVGEVSRYYDELYNDTLYFVFSIIDEETFEIFNIKVITNNNFNDYEKKEYKNKTKVFDNVMEYTETVTFDGEIYTFNTSAILLTSKEKIIIEYESLNLEPQNNFISSLLDKICISA